MDDVRLGRLLRRLRQRRGWRQVDLAARCGLSDSAISDMERGMADRYTLATIRRVLSALGARADLDVTWGGRGDVERLLDADHASLVGGWARLTRSRGWVDVLERSFNHYGDRGVIDHLAFHPVFRIVIVSEVKSGLHDTQGVLGPLDVKVRMAARLAAELGWQPKLIIPALVLADTRTTRRRVDAHAELFARFDVRGRDVRAFLRDPSSVAGTPGGLLMYLPLTRPNQHRLRPGSRQRVRVSPLPPAPPSSILDEPPPLEVPIRG